MNIELAIQLLMMLNITFVLFLIKCVTYKYNKVCYYILFFICVLFISYSTVEFDIRFILSTIMFADLLFYLVKSIMIDKTY